MRNLLLFLKEKMPYWAYILVLVTLWLGMYVLTLHNIYVGDAGEYLDSRLLAEMSTALAGVPR